MTQQVVKFGFVGICFQQLNLFPSSNEELFGQSPNLGGKQAYVISLFKVFEQRRHSY